MEMDSGSFQDVIFITLVLSLMFCVGTVVSNPSIGQSEDTCVYSFQVPRQDSHAACSDSVSLDQQLLKTMVLSLQQRVTQLQEHLNNIPSGRHFYIKMGLNPSVCIHCN